MFFTMVKGTLWRQKQKMFMIAFTVALGISLASAMMNTMLGVGDKVNEELKAYGANINVVPKDASLLGDLYGLKEGVGVKNTYLKEADLSKIKTIFWGYNIVDFSPYLYTQVQLQDAQGRTLVRQTEQGEEQSISLIGTWFEHYEQVSTGEEFTTGIQPLKSWWDMEGNWLGPADKDAILVGTLLAEELHLHVGDQLRLIGLNKEESEEVEQVDKLETQEQNLTSLSTDNRKDKQEKNKNVVSKTVYIKGIFHAGSADDQKIYAPLALVQKLAHLEGKISKIEVSALTTPDNELAKKATQNPKSLLPDEYDTWYCTAYVSSICYQLQEVVEDAVAKPFRQVAESEGSILNKTQLLMLLITILCSIGSALGISNLVTASVMERSQEIALLKALGGSNKAVVALILFEVMLVAYIGAFFGYIFSLGLTQIIAQTVFSSSIPLTKFVWIIDAVLVGVVTLIGSIPAIRYILHLKATEVLHGR